jgi:hypothetical protein
MAVSAIVSMFVSPQTSSAEILTLKRVITRVAVLGDVIMS